MHLLYFCFVDPSGESGENHFTRQLAAALGRAEGVRLSMICPRPAGELPTELKGPRIRSYHLPPKRSGSLWWQASIQPAMWKLTARAARERGRIDGVVVSLRLGALTPLLVAATRRVPHILVLESHTAHEMRRRYPIPGSGMAMGAVTYLNALRSSRVFAAYGGVKEWLEGMPGVDAGKIERFHHCVSPERFPPLSPEEARRTLGLPYAPEDVVVGFVGSFKWYHRVDLLLEAAGLLEREGIHLLLVGDGPERNRLQESSRETEGAASVIFTGNVDARNVGRYVAACDVTYGVIDPTHRGHPMKVYEYLAAGRPVIGAATEGLSFVERVGAGILVEKIAAPRIAEAVRKIARLGRTKRLAMGRAGRRHVISRYTWDALAGRILAAAGESTQRPAHS